MANVKMRAEKKMRQFLMKQIRARKEVGARVAKGPKTAAELRLLGLAPQVFMFKNLFSGQVLYSQVPGYHQNQIDKQFVRPNWENRKPSRRNDLWRVMCVVNFASYDYAVAAYHGLVELRRLRDTQLVKEAKFMRKKNADGNTWFSGQYRPAYTQEAVADLAHVIEEFSLEDTTALWESLWRKGDDKHWDPTLITHDTLPAFNAKHQSVMLDEIREMALAAFADERAAATAGPEAPVDVAMA
ncbi:hypothetical protein METBIDRAFT_38524 [Metschnikowia bicuspidata var. bicuspidata NRRL YB-4993]|uniref:Large ribosomal subunit protein mL67 n=1 Tax=Metschnikowia bicuspidata var. bicuspidata NRRL YB-4993 TaxID=869754 RepID=A0A1A0HIP1_9ASCO|nr:hypothetical protein METBIDRAFT_38524 [Metschnikowia bicuspidata var. bicuspidata NRRL YB-4993]OBA24024.1 hypothetical protein METBIDRAFT_38524 [Metschnikowia bicuspidata var. bicuspidata NRRL YB-4993]